MKTNFQVLDVDYVLVDSKPLVRLFGRTDKNKSITVFYDKFLPYFYLLPQKGGMADIKSHIQKKFKDLVIEMKTVERFLPIGYHEKPAKLLKITLNNPARTPLIRDSLSKLSSVKEVYEADILFKYRFMIDHNIFGMRWYQVDGDGIGTNTVKTDMRIIANSFKEIEKEENINFRYMSFDIETLSSEGGMPNPEKDPIILISIFFYPAYKGKSTMVLAAKNVKKFDEDVLGFPSEKEMLEEFVKIIDQFDPDILCGYNIGGFDIPYIEARLRKNNVSRMIGRCKQKPMSCRKFGNKYRNTIPGRIIADVYDLVKEATTKFGLFKGLKRYGLGDVSEYVLGEGKIDVAHSEIDSHWKDNGKLLKKLIDYSRKDSELAIRILMKKNMLDKFLEISKVSGITLQDALDGGESTRIENLIFREFDKRNFVVSCRPSEGETSRRKNKRRTEGLKGAFVLKPEVGFHDKCVAYLDFRSMYPSIIMSLNICPTTLLSKEEKIEYLTTPFGAKFVSTKIRKGIIPEILDYLLTTRDKIKKQMKRTKTQERKRYLYAKQYALKTVANAFYGYSGYVRARVYVLDIANGITSTGREMIHKTKDIVESKTAYRVIYADTDSVMVKLDTKDIEDALKIGEKISDIINNNIQLDIKMKVENIFKTLLILSKKRYAGWSFEPMDGGWDETIITKGVETVRRDWCDLVSETLQEILNTILKEQDVKKSVKAVKDKISKIKTGKMDLKKLVITKSISKPLKSYKGIQPHVELVKKMKKRDPASAPGVGDRVGFVIIKGAQMLSKRAEDPDYVRKKGLMIDSDYYIHSQLLPPLERVFEALNVDKSDFTGIGKQLGLFEAMKNGVKKQVFEDYLTEIDGLICNSCNNMFRRVPLSGKCNLCNGEIVFFKADRKSRIYDPWQVNSNVKPY